jgi:hypothetical protein
VIEGAGQIGYKITVPGMKRFLWSIKGASILRLAILGLSFQVTIATEPGFGRAEAFAPYYAIRTGPQVGAVAIYDINGDGRNDVAATTTSLVNTNDNNLLIFLQGSQGQLLSPVRYSTWQRSESLAVADFNSDGKPDVAVGIRSAIQVYRQLADGAFELWTNFVTFNSDRIVTGDFNNDGRSDIAGIGGSERKVDIYVQTSTGTLELGVQRAGTYDGAGRDDIEAGDVNGDGLTDIAIMASLHLAVLLQTNGMLGTNYVVPLQFPHSTGVGIGDVTGDGRSDVVVAHWGNQPQSKKSVVAQSGSGTMNSATTYPVYDLPNATVVADVDLDGHNDVILAHDSWERVGVLFGLAFETEQLFPVAYSAFETQGLAVGDINNDELPDIVIGATDSRLGNPEQGLLILTNRLIPALRVSRVLTNPSGHIEISIPYRGKRNIAIEASQTTTDWTPVGTMSGKSWTETNAPTSEQRFYRLKSE